MSVYISEDKMQCYVCKMKGKEICYYNGDYINNNFSICEECNPRNGHDFDCMECGFELTQDHQYLKFLIDIYGEIDVCLFCNVKNRYEFKNANKNNNDKEYLNGLYDKYEEIKIYEKKINSLKIHEDINKKIYKDNFTDYILSENDEDKRKRINKKLRKNILKNKCLSILKEDKNKFLELKIKRDEKINNLKNKLHKNIIKSKVITCLRNLSDDKHNINKVIETVKRYKNKLKFDDNELQTCAINNNRTKMDFFAILYNKKEVLNNISDKDFKLAVDEYHPDKNITRMKKISKVCFVLRKNKIIWNSNIIFKSLYIFQYIEDYQIDYLIKEIQKLIIQ